ncbi:SCO family protein [Deinococcus puniceus]|uniref:Electron transporter n=1 Tax=Deinococcus puniceus TaxID=1182568 RepID=A0A172T7M0_9DEIO|nr:SCO family protein [Deinococcus puniceus]ANE42823.1 electron transporter [Deinococcus puniceus]
MKWLTVVLLALAAALGGLLVFRSGAAAPLGGTVLDTPVALPQLGLTDDAGRPATLADSDGRMRLVFYGFVRCPDVCPATLAILKEAYEGLEPLQQAKLRVQLVSVDPEFDRPTVLREYLNEFSADFVGLTGTMESIDAAAKAMYVVNVAPLPTPTHQNHTDKPDAQKAEDQAATGAASRLHGDQVSVVNPKGEFVRVYSNLEVVNGILKRDLPELLREYGS